MPEKIVAGLKFLRFAYRRFHDDRCLQVAASLSYTTLLALVPLITVLLTVISAFPAFSKFSVDVKNFILAVMVPDAAGRVIGGYTQGFAENAAKLTAVGLVFLAVTALLQMLTIDAAFNNIWRVRRPRPLIQRLLIYWAVLTVGPILIGASLSLTSWLVSESMGLTQQVPFMDEALLRVLPVVLSAIAFSTLYIAVPNCYVPRRDAIAGGVVAALVFESAKRGFGTYISHFASYKLVYGAFAAFPIFLLWVYLSWLVVLLGAVTTASLSNWRGADEYDLEKPAQRFYAALKILRAFYQAFRRGATATPASLSGELNLGFEEIEKLVDELRAAGWVRMAVGGGWVLMRDPAEIKIADVYRRLVFDHEAVHGPADARLHQLLDEISSRLGGGMGMSVKQLFDESEQPGAKAAAGIRLTG